MMSLSRNRTNVKNALALCAGAVAGYAITATYSLSGLSQRLEKYTELSSFVAGVSLGIKGKTIERKTLDLRKNKKIQNQNGPGRAIQKTRGGRFRRRMALKLKSNKGRAIVEYNQGLLFKEILNYLPVQNQIPYLHQLNKKTTNNKLKTVDQLWGELQAQLGIEKPPSVSDLIPLIYQLDKRMTNNKVETVDPLRGQFGSGQAPEVKPLSESDLQQMLGTADGRGKMALELLRLFLVKGRIPGSFLELIQDFSKIYSGFLGVESEVGKEAQRKRTEVLRAYLKSAGDLAKKQEKVFQKITGADGFENLLEQLKSLNSDELQKLGDVNERKEIALLSLNWFVENGRISETFLGLIEDFSQVYVGFLGGEPEEPFQRTGHLSKYLDLAGITLKETMAKKIIIEGGFKVDDELEKVVDALVELENGRTFRTLKNGLSNPAFQESAIPALARQHLSLITDFAKRHALLKKRFDIFDFDEFVHRLENDHWIYGSLPSCSWTLEDLKALAQMRSDGDDDNVMNIGENQILSAQDFQHLVAASGKKDSGVNVKKQDDDIIMTVVDSEAVVDEAPDGNLLFSKKFFSPYTPSRLNNLSGADVWKVLKYMVVNKKTEKFTLRELQEAPIYERKKRIYDETVLERHGPPATWVTADIREFLDTGMLTVPAKFEVRGFPSLDLRGLQTKGNYNQSSDGIKALIKLLIEKNIMVRTELDDESDFSLQAYNDLMKRHGVQWKVRDVREMLEAGGWKTNVMSHEKLPSVVLPTTHDDIAKILKDWKGRTGEEEEQLRELIREVHPNQKD